MLFHDKQNVEKSKIDGENSIVDELYRLKFNVLSIFWKYFSRMKIPIRMKLIDNAKRYYSSIQRAIIVLVYVR